MSKISRFEDLIIWQLAEQQESEIYQLTKLGTFAKDFELINQIRRVSGSVMDNIAEGFGRGGNREFVNFLSISKGSNDETRSQVHRAKNREHITIEKFNELCIKNELLGNKIINFINYLNSSEIKRPKFNRPN